MRLFKTVFTLGLVGLLCAPLQAVAQIDDDCTLTPGYWKTHSEFGPAPYDSVWALLPNGAGTPFYLSGQTWLEVFNTPPRGNAYYILASSFEASILNILAGATAPSAVISAILDADSLFSSCTPAQVASGGNGCGNGLFLSINGTLAAYNEGHIGPGACVE